MRSLFISPHYDDAVFSCGKLIAIMEEPTVLTVFGGMPKNKEVCTAYDQKSGFNSAEEAIIARRGEDSVALTTIGAKQVWFDVPDNQYSEERDYEEVVHWLTRAFKDYAEVFIPLGLLHPDHIITGELLRGMVDDKRDYYVYMDMPYYVDNPEIAVDQLRKLPSAEYTFRGGDLGKKMLAISCYRSQVPITNIYHLMCDERYYKLNEKA